MVKGNTVQLETIGNMEIHQYYSHSKRSRLGNKSCLWVLIRYLSRPIYKTYFIKKDVESKNKALIRCREIIAFWSDIDNRQKNK